MFTNLLGQMAASGAPSSLLKAEKLTYANSNTFKLKGKPNPNGAIILTVNGLVYFDGAEVSYDASTQSFTWKNSKLQLSSNDTIVALYNEEI